MAKVVLDASAALAYLRREPGAERVQSVLGRAVLSSVNSAEAAQKLLELGEDERVVRASLDHLGIEIADFDLPQAMVAASLRRETRALGLSLGDRGCLALAKVRGLSVLTADRAWAAVDAGVEIVLIR